VAGSPRRSSYLFWQRQTDGTYLPITSMVVCATDTDRLALDVPTGFVVFQIVPSVGNVTGFNFWVKTATSWTQEFLTYRYAIGRGSNIANGWYENGPQPLLIYNQQIAFQWKHYAPTDHRIDPSQTNIIDIFVLTTEYDFLTRQWIASGAILADLPLPPTELDLRIAFSEFNNYKMFSDEIVWRPAQYKFLFGEGSEPALRAQFKVVALPNSPYSDGEIKSRVIRAINDYFDVSRWNFGETFYYTALAAYIHIQLAAVIGSVVLVPLDESSSFGDGFEVSSLSDEIFISTAQVSDIIIIGSNTPSNLRIR
jgi:hypothetical protein